MFGSSPSAQYLSQSRIQHSQTKGRFTNQKEAWNEPNNSSSMNTFSAFRFAARTILGPRAPTFPCLVLQTPNHARFKSKKSRRQFIRPRNTDIEFEEVHLREGDNVLTKVSLKKLLEDTDLTNFWVELVAQSPPVVRVVNKKDRFEKDKQVIKKARVVAKRNKVKEVQLTWVSEASDLQHKLARARVYLEMGARVDIVFSGKANVPSLPAHAQQQRVEETIEMMADISTELKPVEWRGNMAIVYLKGTVDPLRKLTAEVDEDAVGKSEAEVDEEAVGKSEAQVDEEAVGKSEEVVGKSEEAVGKSEEAVAEEALPAEPDAAKSTFPPGKPKNFIDLSAEGYVPPPRRNPLAAMKAVKKYGTRKYKPT